MTDNTNKLVIEQLVISAVDSASWFWYYEESSIYKLVIIFIL